MNIYTSLPTLKGMLAQPGRKALGALGEQVAMALLQKTGRYQISNCHQGEKRGDLRVIDLQTGELLRVEVKTARMNKANGRNVNEWKFTLLTATTDYRHADVLILLPVLKTGEVVPFIIPVSELGNRKRISITSHPEDYAGKWSQYRQKTHNLRLS